MRQISLVQKCLLYLSIPFYVLILGKYLLLRTPDYNAIHNRKPLSGHKVAAVSAPYLLASLKSVAHGFGVSINDLTTTILSMTLKEYLAEKGDKDTNKLMFIMPYSMRPPPKDPKKFDFNN